MCYIKTRVWKQITCNVDQKGTTSCLQLCTKNWVSYSGHYEMIVTQKLDQLHNKNELIMFFVCFSFHTKGVENRICESHFSGTISLDNIVPIVTKNHFASPLSKVQIRTILHLIKNLKTKPQPRYVTIHVLVTRNSI